MRHPVFLISETAERNVAIVHNMGDELVPPYKIRRNPALMIVDEEPEELNPQKINRKKAEVIDSHARKEEEEMKEEKIPLELEDSEQRVFVGMYTQTKITDDHKSTYYALTRERGEIKMQKISKLYKFSPKIQHQVMTLEEAEEKMQKKTKDQSATEMNRAEKEKHREEDLEYKEVFDDDDGEVTGAEKEEKNKRKRLDSSGKDMRKIVKSYEEESSEGTSEVSEEKGKKTEEEKSMDITELDIKMHLYAGPIPIKKLIEQFKKNFKSNPGSKETLRSHIKRICNIRTDPKTGEKLLVLKGTAEDEK